MAKRSEALLNEPPADWTPTQAVDEPVINNPYDEPGQHWIYKDGVPLLMPGRRRASYWFKTKKTGSGQQELFAEEESDDLPLVNLLRRDVKRWRDVRYRGASNVTKDLLGWWSREDRPRRLFFCQKEAMETIIYLLEMAIPGRLSSTLFKNFEVGADDLSRLLKGNRPGFATDEHFFPRLVDPPGDKSYLPLQRLGCKMATGSGKTVVMAMLITWAFCNRGRNPGTTDYPNAVLVCAPNLTVRNRLQVLRPESPDNFYDAFDIVPAKYRELMGSGKVLVTNWHGFALKSPNREGDTSYRVVNKGEETPEAFARDRLGDLAGRVPILVLNDEGHHCWRSNPVSVKETDKGLTSEEKKALEEEAEEARVWLAGLDRINSAGLLGTGKPCILSCVDLSATPFYLGNSGYPEGNPFPWLVSDFGLIDAIESGIVKIPRLPVKDDSGSKDDAGRPDPKYFRLWKHINDNLKPEDKLAKGRPKPDAVFREAQGALLTLASQWKKRFEEIRQSSSGDAFIPPVLIVVCDNTDISEIVYQQISGEKVIEEPSSDGKSVVKRTVYQGNPSFPELANEDGVRRTVRIDSKLLAKAETEDGETKDQAAKALREIIDTVGRPGRPGGEVRCVVSVSMLTEGWDATNVTHILGIRAFDSQLLCEQVVGRGLRRMNYTPDPVTKKLPPEYVDVYGIPFSLVPFKGKPQTDNKPDPVYHHIYALPERAEFEIRMPVVESYTYDLKGSGIICDIDKLAGFIVDHEPTGVYLTPTRGYHEDSAAIQDGDFVRQDRQVFYESVRFQQVVFRLAQMIVDRLIQGGSGAGIEKLKASRLARHQIFPDIVRIVLQYIDKKVTFALLPDGTQVDRRELALEKYAKFLCDRIVEEIRPHAAPKEAPLLPIVNSYKPFVSTGDVNYRTTRPVLALTKSHLNHAVPRSSWENQAIKILEELDCVECFSPNDRNVGLVVPYEYAGAHCQYEPDFAIKLKGGKLLLLEIKGEKGAMHDRDRVLAKNAAARKWVAAVNNAGGYGTWEFDICYEIPRLTSLLRRHAIGLRLLPFRYVTPTPEERYRSAVPLTPLYAAAGGWSQDQLDLVPLDWVEDWVSYDTSTKFEPDMFVALVEGDSMEPVIPDGSYCLFRYVKGTPRDGKPAVVWHESLSDPQTGGKYTIKYLTVEPTDGTREGRVILKPANKKYEPITLPLEQEDEFRVIAEFLEVLRGDAARN